MSIYVPTHRRGRETRQDPIRFMNLLRQAESRLSQEWAERPDTVLEPCHALLGDVTFWRHQADGLAVFAAGGLFRCFRLPMTVDELLIVGASFHLSPLLPLVSGDGHFFVLALSQNAVRLFDATRLSMDELEVPQLPQNLEVALAGEEHEKQLQLRSVEPTRTGERTVIFHGHGGGKEDIKELLARYFRAVDRAVCERLAGQRAPLLLAGVRYYLPIYRSVTAYPKVLDGGVTGNPDALSPMELHAWAWAVAEPHFAAGRQETLAAYQERRGTARTADRLETIVPAARHGRVDALFVRRGASRWGCVDEATDSVTVHRDHGSQDVDLVDLAATRTLLTGGAVFVLDPEEMPERRPAAALLRY